MPELLYFLFFGVWIYSLIDIGTSRREDVRNLPKWAWFVVVFVSFVIGSALWFFFGRPQRVHVMRDDPPPRPAAPRPHLARRTRPARPDPVDDEDAVRARIAERDQLLERWAEEERRRTTGDGQ